MDVLQFLNQHPEKAKSPDEALRKMMEEQRLKRPLMIVMEETPTPIRDRDASISSKLAQVVDKSIKKDMDKRFQSAADFSRQLGEAMHGE